MNTNTRLIKSDWKIIGRDPMLLLCFFAPALLIIVAKILVPFISRITTIYLSFPIDEYYYLISLFFMVLTPMMFGMIYGFILLDERDGGIISYLSITPIGKIGYFKIRMLIPVIFSFFWGIIFLLTTGFGSFLNFAEIIAISAIVSLEAPMMLLFLGAFASNKVEGMAISKGFGIIIIPVLFDYFFTGNWRWILSVSPVWWIERAVFYDSFNRWLYILGALIIHLFVIFLLYRKFEKRFN